MIYETNLQILEPPLWRCKMDLAPKASPEINLAPITDQSRKDSRMIYRVGKISGLFLLCSNRSARDDLQDQSACKLRPGINQLQGRES